jgi:hypothetical protein
LLVALPLFPPHPLLLLPSLLFIYLLKQSFGCSE